MTPACERRSASRSARSATVFANPSLRRIQLANASSIVGGWAYVVALAVFAYEEDGALRGRLARDRAVALRRASLRRSPASSATAIHASA